MPPLLNEATMSQLIAEILNRHRARGIATFVLHEDPEHMRYAFNHTGNPFNLLGLLTMALEETKFSLIPDGGDEQE